MVNKEEFMELLKSIVEIAKTQGNTITQVEIKQHFSYIKLEDEHYDYIYEYLSANKIKVQGFIYVPSAKDTETVETQEEDNLENDNQNSLFFNMYLQELQEIEPLQEQEEKILFMDLLNGQEYAKKRLTEGWLIKVVELAKEYKDRDILIEDLIQEGNIGLLSGIEHLFGKKEKIDAAKYLKESIVYEMEQLIEYGMTEDDWQFAILAKANLISEAANYLAGELGRVATLKELSDYTKLPKEEIEEIRAISLDAIKIGEGDYSSMKIKVKKSPKLKD